jgi:hypothetical protein
VGELIKELEPLAYTTSRPPPSMPSQVVTAPCPYKVNTNWAHVNHDIPTWRPDADTAVGPPPIGPIVMDNHVGGTNHWTGQAWRYDFVKGVFEKTAGVGGGETGLPGDRPKEAAELPVEVRCTEEIRFEPYEKSIVVGQDEFVEGDISAFGKITVRGWVKGSVESVRGPVIVSEGGQVDGDIRAPEITLRRGAIHLGKQTLTDPLEFPKGLTQKFETAGLWVVFGMTLFLLLAAFLYFTLMPSQVDHFGRCVARYPVKSAAVGLLFVFGLPVLVVLLAITLVGVLLIPLVPFAYLFAISLGVVTTGKLIGGKILRASVGGEYHPVATAGTGLLVFIAVRELPSQLWSLPKPSASKIGLSPSVSPAALNRPSGCSRKIQTTVIAAELASVGK